MKERYSYLNDPRALAEIRKHKWIESQKQGAEIGFASAAVDWIHKYGEAWRHIHNEGDLNAGIFLERRRYRRFRLKGSVRLVSGNETILAEPLDLSFFGLLCRVSRAVSLGTPMRVLLPAQEAVDCYGRVERIVAVDAGRFDLFFSFNACCQNKLSRVLAA
jgi:hypothetical protein